MEGYPQRQRIKLLNNRPPGRGAYLLYWMQASQRTEYNHALEYAIIRANELNKPLVVYFGIAENYPESNERHFHFMLEGIREVRESLAKRGIAMILKRESPENGILRFARNASMVITDCGYTKIQKSWRNYAARKLDRTLAQVESDVIVPVETVSLKEEYSAATIRRKIEGLLPLYLFELNENKPVKSSLGIDLESLQINNVDMLVASLNINRDVRYGNNCRGGTTEARKLLKEFINNKLEDYSKLKNDPSAGCTSGLSPYLHFGQISPLYIALQILHTGSKGQEAFLEELVIRRELAINYVHYNEQYDSFSGLPAWAQKTLLDHSNDPRPYHYNLKELEQAKTHDIYWNAAQIEMVKTGYMHGYMRMYWGKKIMEWTTSPQEAYRTALWLNNKYELDGRDPNSFTGIAWCFGKHDRPWVSRPVFGSIRYMNDSGLKRKFDIDKYVEAVKRL